MVLDIIFNVIGGLGIFLLGMKYMSEGMQTIAGSRLRLLINAVTNNRVMAATIGMLVTFAVQSSSVTTVMVVGFVNSGIMTLMQAIGVIMGANIGTTITGWIVLIPVAKYGLPLLGVSALFYLFSKNERSRYIALVLMGFGMIFFGMELMKNGFKPIRGEESFRNWFLAFEATTFLGIMKCVAVGCILTMIVQSSSATLVITINLATAGLIHFESAAALVMGQNIGTTITAYLASLGATTNAKRAAYAHILFNVLGVIWIIILFDPFMDAVKWGLPYDLSSQTEVDGQMIFTMVGVGIATTHSIFNIVNTLLFLPFTGHLARFLERIQPDKPFKEAPHLTHLDVRMLETPVIGIEQSRVEILRMGENVKRMLLELRFLLVGDEANEEHIREVFHKEEVLDIMQKEIVSYLTDLFTENAPHDVVEEARQQLRLADEAVLIFWRRMSISL